MCDFSVTQLPLSPALSCRILRHANDVGEEITTFVDASDYYKALRASRKLIAHEVRTLDAFNSDMTKLSEIAAGAGDDDEDDQISSIQDEKELLNDT